MKNLIKNTANKIVTILIIIALFALTGYYFKDKIVSLFGGTTDGEYSYVIKRFSKQVELVVADAETETKRHQTFENKSLKDWPDWTEPITKLFIGRDMKVEVLVGTEFKINLRNITSEDITIENRVLKFKKPLEMEVDSQQIGNVKIADQSSGVIDKAVDLVTSSKKAQEFLAEKTDETVYNTSKYILKKKKVDIYKASEEALSSIININSKEKIKVHLNKNDLIFKIKDKK